jgi:hypothetical protein
MKNEIQSTNHERGGLHKLLALNAGLLVLLGAVTFGSIALGQARGRGEYTMVAGGAQGSDAQVVYVIDVSNQEMVAVVFNPDQKTLEGVGYRNLAADAASLARARQRPTP